MLSCANDEYQKQLTGLYACQFLKHIILILPARFTDYRILVLSGYS